jgi:hypothetical protein
MLNAFGYRTLHHLPPSNFTSLGEEELSFLFQLTIITSVRSLITPPSLLTSWRKYGIFKHSPETVWKSDQAYHWSNLTLEEKRQKTRISFSFLQQQKQQGPSKQETSSTFSLFYFHFL